MHFCYTVRADDARGTVLRVLHEMIHFVFTMAFIISYYEATKTQRDELTFLIPTARPPLTRPPSSVARL